jgi:hypothetical protein
MMGMKKFEPSEPVREIVEGLHELLNGSVVLHDEQDEKLHFCMRTDFWFSAPDHEANGELVFFSGCNLSARINDRWTVTAGSGVRHRFHHNAESIVKWAAERLAVHLPRLRKDDETMLPPAGGGGSGGSSEIGIPVSWARKIRN